MDLSNLKVSEGSLHSGKRVGRGLGSGMGKPSTRGQKGAGARSGGAIRPGFEGGQNPLFRRLPKHGFTNFTRVEYAIVNVEDLNRFEDDVVVTPTLLKEAGLVTKELNGVKILGKGALTKKLTVKASKFSKSAEAAIKNAGGTIEVI